MSTITADSVITQKTLELCQTILDQPEFQVTKGQIDSFMADEHAQTQYQLVMQKGDMLQHKQQMGLPLTNEEILEFEKQREALVNNPVAQGFIAAQQHMHGVQESVGQYLAKTFELGRLPSSEDFSAGSCGSGCGCHH